MDLFGKRLRVRARQLGFLMPKWRGGQAWLNGDMDTMSAVYANPIVLRCCEFVRLCNAERSVAA
jgi:hypothetical protein